MSCYYHYVLSFGSNLGDRQDNIVRGRRGLERFGSFVKVSRLEETAPLPSVEYDVSDHGFYLNGVAIFASRLDPRGLYQEIRSLEDEIGHCRYRRWAPRELDVDVLLCARSEDGGADFASGTPLHYVGADGFLVPHRSFPEREFLGRMLVHDLCISTEIIAKHLSLGALKR
jgi:2-amino-4-hydroxy-6-hydroxymethyldihydropteridine diphosphokinase